MVTVVQGKVCAKNHPDRLSRLATIHQRYRQTDRQTDGRTDFLWNRPGPNGRPKIRHNFYWTDVAKTVKDYVDSCLACQKKTRAVVKDRVPISVIPRYEIGLPFSHLYLDVIGLLTELCRPNRFVYTVSICISVAVCHSKGRV